MNIAHLVYSLARGGQEKLLMDLAIAQKRRGHRVLVGSLTGKEGPFAEALEAEGIPVTAFGKQDGMSPRLLWNLQSLLRQNNVEVLHAHNHVSNFYGAMAAKLAGVRAMVNTRHGMGGPAASSRQERVFRFSTLFTDRVVHVCDAAKDHFVGSGIVPRHKARTVYNGVPLELYQCDPGEEERSAFLKEQGIPGDALLFGTVCRLVKEKDIGTLLRAAKVVRQSLPKAHLVIIGSGTLAGELQELTRSLGLEDGVHFLGDRRDVGRLLSYLDLFVLSSSSEGMPLTLIEAMAAGRPTVVTQAGGMPEVVLEGETGMVVPCRNPDALAVAITKILADKGLASRMGAAARARAQQDFHLDTMVDVYQRMYEDILAGRSR